MMTRLRRRWRYRAARVARIRAMVYAYRCAKCGARDWEDHGEQPVDPFYSAFRRLWVCRACGWDVLD